MKVWIAIQNGARKAIKDKAEVYVWVEISREPFHWDENRQKWRSDDANGICVSAISELLGISREEIAAWEEPKMIELAAKGEFNAVAAS